MKNTAIAAELHISEHTVDHHLRVLYKRASADLGHRVGERASLVIWFCIIHPMRRLNVYMKESPPSRNSNRKKRLRKRVATRK